MLGKFIFCFVVAVTVAWCLPVQAKIESNGSITYKEAVKAGKKSLKKIEKKSNIIIDTRGKFSNKLLKVIKA